MHSRTAHLAFLILSLVWLPAGIVLVAWVRFGQPPPDPQLWLSLLPAIPAGLPLTYGCWFIFRQGRSRLAWILFALLAIPAIFAATAGGLLGPAGIIAGGLAASLPAWAVFGAGKLAGRTGR